MMYLQYVVAAAVITKEVLGFTGVPRNARVSTSMSEQTVKDLDLSEMQTMFNAASMGIEGLPGSEGPELRKFDPLRFAEKSPEWVPWFRESELKHGRVAMLATAGIVAADFVRLPGDVFQAGSVLEAHNNMVASGAMIQLLLWIGLLEIITIPALQNLGKSDRKPGNYGFDPLGFGKNPTAFKKYEQNELKNGRLAMLAFSGIITQAALTGKEFPYF
eukprot:gene4619-9176_t